MFLPSAGSMLFKNGILLRRLWSQPGGLKIVSSYWCQVAKEGMLHVDIFFFKMMYIETVVYIPGIQVSADRK